MAERLGIVFLADPRYPGGTTRALAAEARALFNAGLSAGFCPVLGPELNRGAAIHTDLVPPLADGTLRFVDPASRVRARLAILHHPVVFTHLPARPLGLTTETLVLVLHHPPFDARGRPSFDLAAIVRNLVEVFDCAVTLAPVGPAVRAQLGGVAIDGAHLLDDDWSNLLDFAAWPARTVDPGNETHVIGRHSRPQRSKFPDTLAEALLAYPERPDITVRMLGAADDLPRDYGRVPTNWQLLPFDAEPVRAFLAGLDSYVYLHASDWVEAFGYGILEAVATGVPVILPPRFRATFGPAAIYAAPGDMLAAVERLVADPERSRAHVRAARRHAENRFSVDRFVPRLDRVAPGWDRPATRPATRPDPPDRPDRPRGLRIVMATSNGVGLGHLTRLLAIARRMPEGTQTAFFTMSQGYEIARQAGYLTQFVPFHRATGASQEAWNVALEEEAGDFLDLVQPDVVVFDGNIPYAGLIAALDARRHIRRTWVRRALWRAVDPIIAKRAREFDLIIEPQEYSARLDTMGRDVRSASIVVPPIVQIAQDERLGRAEARAELGLSADDLAVGLMLGAGTNFAFGAIRQAILDDLARRPGVVTVEIVPPLVALDRHAPQRQVRLYPAARHSAAFDFMVAGAGYNSFHEALMHRVPTVFVPNEAGEMDLQLLRARHALSVGAGELLRARDGIRVPQVLDRMCDAGVRAEMTRRMGRIAQQDGAEQAAALISNLGRFLRLRQSLV